MNHMSLRGAALAAFAVALISPSMAFSFLGTKWGMGPNVAQQNAGNLGTPGGATWSIMGVGLSMSAINDDHGTNVTTDFGLLIGGPTLVEEIAAIDAAMNTWASISGFDNLGMVADGGSDTGSNNISNGHRGDIRFGAGLGFGGELAHAWQPGTFNLFSFDWNKGGDVHVNTAFTWSNDPADTVDDADFDLQTVLLHEIGHALGLGHSAGSVMDANYGGAARSLTADDIAGIQTLYGIVPEPASMTALGLGAIWLARRKRKA